MNKVAYRATIWLVMLISGLAAQVIPPTSLTLAADGANVQEIIPAALSDPQVWTRWHPAQYALAEDSQALWIGAAGGVIRWDKTTKSHRRYTAIDGLPHQNVYAVAIDGAGTRWFGGDGGLSRLDSNNTWTHFTQANSGIYRNLVVAIAIDSDNTLWLSHGLPAGSVSRRDPDGNWRWFPSRGVAVASDYSRLQQTRNPNRLWTLFGDEIWVDYWVYTGERWLDRTPEGVTTAPQGIAASSTAVWAVDGYLRKWSGGAWSLVTLPSPSGFIPWSALSVDSNDVVWAGGQVFTGSPVGPMAESFLAQISPTMDVQKLDRAYAVTAILPTAAGAWAIGPGWLVQPDKAIYDFADVPALSQIYNMLLDGEGALWLYSEGPLQPLYPGWQSLVDQRTPSLQDDRWSTTQLTAKRWDILTALTRAPGGDLWATWSTSGKGGPRPADKLLWRLRQDGWHSYQWPDQKLLYVTDIFAQDDSHIWFAYPYGVLALDDRGTPTDLTDDRWRDYPLDPPEYTLRATVAVDTLGRLWWGNVTGLYRYEGDKWQRQIEGEICDLMPTGDGALLAQPGTCDQYNALVYSDGTGTVALDDFVKDHFAQVRSANRPNRLWAVAADGAVWYAMRDYSGGTTDPKLYRRTATELTKYPLPIPMEDIRGLEVDQDNRVWIGATSGLWRMSAQPDFRVAASGALWLAAPGGSRRESVAIERLSGHSEPVTLQLRDLPAGVTAQLTPNPVPVGVPITVTLTAAADAPLGQQRVTLIGADGNSTHTAQIELAVVAQVIDHYLPVIGNSQR